MELCWIALQNCNDHFSETWHSVPYHFKNKLKKVTQIKNQSSENQSSSWKKFSLTDWIFSNCTEIKIKNISDFKNETVDFFKNYTHSNSLNFSDKLDDNFVIQKDLKFSDQQLELEF